MWGNSYTPVTEGCLNLNYLLTGVFDCLLSPTSLSFQCFYARLFHPGWKGKIASVSLFVPDGPLRCPHCSRKVIGPSSILAFVVHIHLGRLAFLASSSVSKAACNHKEKTAQISQSMVAPTRLHAAQNRSCQHESILYSASCRCVLPLRPAGASCR